MATTILGLPELEPAQTQKYLTVNQALQRLDALVNLTVFNRTQSSPPTSPSPGDRYIVGPAATGAFANQENRVALLLGSNWIFFTPSEGWRAYDQTENRHIAFNGTSWIVTDVQEVKEEVQRLDALVNLTVFNRTQTSPPPSPSSGDRYIVAEGATGAFANQENKVALFLGSDWIFFTPSEGWRAYDQTENKLIIFDGTSWVVEDEEIWEEIKKGADERKEMEEEIKKGADERKEMEEEIKDIKEKGGGIGIGTDIKITGPDFEDGSFKLLGVNAIPDETHRLAVTSPEVMFNHEDNDFNLIMNKQDYSDDVRVILRSNNTTKAEFGLIGNDNLIFKTSSDGSNYKTALNIDKNGHVGIAGATPDIYNSLIIKGENILHTHEGGNACHKINKNDSTRQAKIEFQSNFSTKTEMGLLGNNEFRIKARSAKNASIVIGPRGSVGIGAPPRDNVHVLSINGQYVLHSNSNGGVHHELNRKGSSDQAAIRFLTTFTRQVEMGLFNNNDDFKIKFAYKSDPSLIIDNKTGSVLFPKNAKFHGFSNFQFSHSAKKWITVNVLPKGSFKYLKNDTFTVQQSGAYLLGAKVIVKPTKSYPIWAELGFSINAKNPLPSESVTVSNIYDDEVVQIMSLEMLAKGDKVRVKLWLDKEADLTKYGSAFWGFQVA